ncbi:MAG: hypothetical protein AB7O50_05865 [Pseudolabrys sp.]
MTEPDMTAMVDERPVDAEGHHAWDPGLDSELPRAFLPLATVFRPENVSTPLDKAQELSAWCGLPAHELVAYRPERLAVHETLIHVTTGISVPDGRDYEDLGRNFRDIAGAILTRHVMPHGAELARILADAKRDAAALIGNAIKEAQVAPRAVAPAVSPGLLQRLFRSPRSTPSPPKSADRRELDIIEDWARRAEDTDDPLAESCFEALYRVGNAVFARHGRLFGNADLLSEIAGTLVCNDYGSALIGETIAPIVRAAAEAEGFRLLPSQEHPVVMNIKGASASGKSSMRPLQKDLARKLNFPWEDFALISPDIWRKFLLDYGSLGAAYKYAGTLSGHELEAIDKKLDRRMAARAARERLPHLLIDRFRFDSFVPELEGQGSSRLLTRFGDLVYLFFMITPPEATVERAWLRGLKVGRYKAVEDLLAHNVEAYTGMPELFFTWALATGKRVHYEFLDNSVPLGEPPRTVACGWNTEMTILDVGRMIDIDRFRNIDIRARRPEEVYRGRDLTPARNLAFLKRCARWIPAINFADQNTGRIYARLEDGRWTWRDEALFADAMRDPETKAGLEALGAVAAHDAGSQSPAPVLAAERQHTLGRWGNAAASPAR